MFALLAPAAVLCSQITFRVMLLGLAGRVVGAASCDRWSHSLISFASSIHLHFRHLPHSLPFLPLPQQRHLIPVLIIAAIMARYQTGLKIAPLEEPRTVLLSFVPSWPLPNWPNKQSHQRARLCERPMTSQEFVGSVELVAVLLLLLLPLLSLMILLAVVASCCCCCCGERAVINRAHDFSKISGVAFEWRRVQANGAQGALQNS